MGYEQRFSGEDLEKRIPVEMKDDVMFDVPVETELNIGSETKINDEHRLNEIRDALSGEAQQEKFIENGRDVQAGNRAVQEKGGKFSRWVRKTLGIAGAVGIGYLGGQELKAEDSTNSLGKTKPESSQISTNKFEKRHFTGYGIDVSNTVEVDKDGKIVKTVNNSFQAKDSSGRTETVRESIPTTAKKTHVEKRTFNGYGVNVVNTVEVDEDGKIVRTIKSESR